MGLSKVGKVKLKLLEANGVDLSLKTRCHGSKWVYVMAGEDYLDDFVAFLNILPRSHKHLESYPLLIAVGQQSFMKMRGYISEEAWQLWNSL